jgi:XTP/dITP diphosphohydrolase
MAGRLVRAPRGTHGFGYDPIFVADDRPADPDGAERTNAELDPADKDAISHRGRAFRALAETIATL